MVIHVLHPVDYPGTPEGFSSRVDATAQISGPRRLVPISLKPHKLCSMPPGVRKIDTVLRV